jgi:hypothetical protein
LISSATIGSTPLDTLLASRLMVPAGHQRQPPTRLIGLSARTRTGESRGWQPPFRRRQLIRVTPDRLGNGEHCSRHEIKGQHHD